ncbi:TPA: type II toxin-antitoxin system HicA family toxin [Pseudomonas aeruginosa]|nr:type II toxin-antitoxin system HicA family toxin [Pseudomonas aeruginosa]
MANRFLRGCGEDLKRLVSFAQSAGWTVQQTRKLHLKFTKPGRQPVFTSGTPSDRRAWLNAKAQLSQADKLAGGAAC